MAILKDFARVGGQSVTQFQWDGKTIAFAHQVSVQSPTPVGQGTVPIHPLDAQRPVELITPFATTMGMIQLEIYDTFGSKVWEKLAGYLDGGGGSGVVDLADIYVAVARHSASAQNGINVQKVVSPFGKRGKLMVESYHNIVIASAQDDETIQIGTMEVLKRIQLNYTHSTWALSATVR